MTDTLFEVVQANGPVSIQDLGRRRSFHHGVTEGGAMDLHAAMWANRLLSLEVSSPLLEITLGMFEIVFRRDCRIAITGADLGARLAGRPIEPWRTFTIHAGEHLRFTAPKVGLRAYMAIDAALDLTLDFGSVSTVTHEQRGGIGGRNLMAGDRISGRVRDSAAGVNAVPPGYIPDYREKLVIDLIPGYQYEQFPDTSIDQLFASDWEIRSNSTRWAYCLSGKPVTHSINQLLSEGIAYGAIQIPPDGQPIIFLNDRQTMGGYPKVGCIARYSGWALSQRFAPTSVRFQAVSADQALQKLIQYRRFFESGR